MKRIFKTVSVLLVFIVCFSYLPKVSAASVLGDINSDGKVTTKDARIALNMAAGVGSFSEEEKKSADFDGDGKVTLEDARCILATAVGMDLYFQSLVDKGFPVSYADYLSDLHKEYPDWVFIPMLTGLDWEESIKQERNPHRKQLIQKSATSAFLCSCSSCKGVIQEGSTWVSASEEAVSYYMDPRNFLDEKYIFQFESTLYDSSHTKAGVEAILKGTWMYDSYITYVNALGTEKTYTVDEKKVKYSQLIMDTAEKSGLSAYYIASKIVQEVGSTSSANVKSASGVCAPYKGIYNYYNIGATTGAAAGLKWANGYMKTASSAVMYKTASTSASKVVTVPEGNELYYIGSSGNFYRVRATVSGTSYSGYVLKSKVTLNTTYGRPWTSPQKSIVNGADYILEKFAQYQYNGYLQKFNVNAESGKLYNNEYMANVQAAASEAFSVYKAYKAMDILDDKKTFIIPVFENMPNANLTREDIFKKNAPSLSASDYSASSLTLSWTELPGAEKYQVYKYNASSEKYERIATVSALSYTDSDFSSKGESRYKVRAYYVNDRKETVYSSSSDVFVACAPPSTPSGLSVSSTTETSVKLKWKDITCDKYVIYRYDSSAGGYKSIGSTTSNSFTDTDLKKGTTYKYKVRAYNSTKSDKFYSAYSSAVTATTKGEATKAGVVSISSGNLNVRESASTSADILVKLQAGHKVTITGESGDWYKINVTVDGEKYTGYVSAKYIELTSSEPEKEECPYTEPTAILRNGSSGEGVRWVQWYLYKLGYLSSLSDVDGAFGSGTLTAVKSFQEDANIAVDGVVGSGTRTALKSAYGE